MNVFYALHYDTGISPNLTVDEKVKLATEISNLSQKEPFWLSENDFIDQFPLLKGLVNVKLSGNYLYAIMQGLQKDLGMK